MANTGIGFIPVLDQVQQPQQGASDYKPLFADLGVMKTAALPELIERKRAAVEDSLVGKLGLNPDGIVGETVNTATSFGAGASRFVGNMLTAIPDTISGLAQASVPENVIEAYNRTKGNAPTATAEDWALLNSDAPSVGDEGVTQSYLNRIQSTQTIQQATQKVANAFDLSKYEQQDSRNALSDSIADNTAKGVAALREAKQQYDQGNLGDAALSGFKGVGSIIAGGAKSVAQNPAGTGQYVVENTPQLLGALVAPVTMPASNAGYGLDTYRKGITDYADDYMGQVPESADRTRMGLAALSAAAAEQLGDHFMLKGFTDSGKGIGRAASAFVGSSAREAVTEGYQTWAENEAQNKPTSIEDVVEAGVIGGAVGGAIQAAGSLQTRARGVAESAADRINAEANSRAETQPAYDEAIKTGDVTDLAKQDPVRAVQALGELAKDATPDQVDQHIKTADNIQQDLTQRVSGMQEKLATYNEEGIAQMQSLREDMVNGGASKPELDMVDAEIKEMQDYTPKQRKADEARLSELNNQLDSVRLASERLKVDTTPEVAPVVEQASEGNEQAVNKALTLTMLNPDAITREHVETMVNSGNLTTEQATALNDFVDAQDATNALKDRAMVNSDVINGGNGFKGLNQYRDSIRQALSNGNVNAATTQLTQLQSFAATRESKAQAIEEAYRTVKGTNDKLFIAPNASGNWVQTDTKQDNGLEVSARSFRLAADVRAEANALSTNAQAFDSMIKANPQMTTAAPVADERPDSITPEETTAEVAPVEQQTAPVEQTEEAPAVKEQPAGTITAIKESTGVKVDSSNRQQVNIVGEQFTQKEGSDTDKTKRPLVSTKDFVSAARKDPSLVRQHLAQKGDLLEAQRTALNSFFRFTTKADDLISKTFGRRKAADFRFQDYSQYFINEDGSVDENVKTAIAYGMFTWMAENANNLYNTDEAINMILQNDSDAEVSPAAYAALGKIGTREDVIANRIGDRIVDALGLTAKPGSPASDKARLSSALGAKAMEAMYSAGWLKRTEISDAKMQALMNSGVTPTKAIHTFATIKTVQKNEKTIANATVRDIKEKTTGSQSVLNKLMGIEAASTEPSFQPVKFNQKFAKRTNRDVPSVLADILNKEGAKGHSVRQDSWQVWGTLSTAALEQIAGVMSVTDEVTHAYNRLSREAKNAGLQDQVANFNDFVKKMVDDPTTDGIDQKMYFGRSVWMPQRVGLSTNLINPQTSKVHRHMLSMEGWESTIDPSNAQDMNNFKLRVLESFGVKTEAKGTGLVLQGYDAKVNTPVIQKAVDTLAEILRGEATNVDENAILEGVAEAGENFHSLDGLIALAHQKNADGKPFKATLMAEVDGITNGPMLSLLQLGAKDFGTMNQGGFYRRGQLDDNGNQLAQFNDYHGMAGNLDLYEGTMSAVLSRFGTEVTPELAAVQAITGDLRTAKGDVTKQGRNLIKKPLTAMMFGSNTETAVGGMADAFIDSIYTEMEKAASKKDNARMTQILSAVNTMIGKGQQLDVNMGIQPAMETILNKGQTDRIKQTFHEQIGSKTEDALTDTYGVYIARRDTTNKSAQLAYSVYNAAYEALVEHYEKTSDSINYRVDQKGNRRLLSSLSQEDVQKINDRLKDAQPILQTALSKQSNQLEAGMNMSKSKREMNRTEPFTSEVYFGQPVPTFDENGNEVINGRKQTQVNGMSSFSADPGVAPFITSTHSLDSAIASTVYGSMNALNVHDALGVGVHDAANVGEALNRATYQHMLNYSSATEMVSTLERTLTAVQKLMEDPEIAPGIQSRLHALTQAMQKKGNSITNQLNEQRGVATQAETQKLQMLADMHAVSQYGTEGGSYIVTAADRKAASEAIKNVGSTFTKEGLEAANYLDEITSAKAIDLKAAARKAISNNSVETLAPAVTLNTMERLEQTPEVQAVREAMIKDNLPLASAKTVIGEAAAADLVQDIQANTGKMSVWGEIGNPLVASNQGLVQLLEPNTLTAHDLIDALHAMATVPFNQKLLSMVKRIVPKDLDVIYVTPNTPEDGALGTNVSKARGWYYQDSDFSAIYVKSPDFVESGITPEMLTHELVHAALSSVVEQHTGRTTDAGKAVADLENLRSLASDMVNGNDELSSKYANALSNVHELLAWGLTNRGFQTDVLAKVSVQTTKTGLINGLRKFISSLTTLMFRGNATKADETGLGLLVANAAGLFQAAADLRKLRNSQTRTYEDAVDHINAMSSAEVLEALESASPRVSSQAHQAHMAETLDELVTPLYGVYGAMKEEASANRAITPDDVYMKAIATGKKPFSSQALTGSFALNHQEAFLAESLHAAFETAMTNPNTLFARQGLENVWRDAKTKLKDKDFHNGDWSIATQDEKDLAEAKREQLFGNPSSVTGKNTKLSQFAAMALASEEVRNVLNFMTNDPSQPLKGLSWVNKVTEIFRRMMTKLGSLATKVVPGDLANDAIRTLVGQMVDIEAKRKTKMMDRGLTAIDQVNLAAGKIGQVGQKALAKVAGSNVFTQSKSNYIRALGSAARIAANDQGEELMNAIGKIRDQAQARKKPGVLTGIAAEFRGMHDGIKTAVELFRQAKRDEKQRKDMIETTVSAFNQAFTEGGARLTQQSRDSLTKAMLRTNMSALYDKVGMTRLTELLESPQEMKLEKAKLEAQLQGLTQFHQYMSSATKDLAYHRVTGKNASDNLMLNTDNIANMLGTKRAKGITTAQAKQVREVLDQLLPIYAHQYSNSVDRAHAMDVLRTENARTDGKNGIEFMLKLHSGLQKQSEEYLFKNQTAMMTSGYTPEIHDNRIDVLMVDRADIDAHERMGYVQAGALQHDPHDQDKSQRVLMTRRGSGQTGLITGALSFTGNHRKGTSPERPSININGQNRQVSSKKMLGDLKKAKAQAVEDLFNRTYDYDPSAQLHGKMVPVMDPNGNIADYRYMMNENTRDVLLDRNNSADQMLGVMAGQIVDKVNTANQNVDVVRALRDQYDTDYHTRPNSYVKFGKDSTDPELAELYRLLPEDTKKEIRNTWKGDNMMVPSNQLALIAGYRKYSATQAFDKGNRELTKRQGDGERTWAEQLFVQTVNAFLGEKSQWRVGQAEDVVQAAVKAMKDILVIKNIKTLVGNIMSNFSILAIEGMNPKDMVQYHAVAIKGAIDYRRDNKRLIQLSQAKEIGYIPEGVQTIDNEIADIRDRMARNPIKDLVDAGLMPTIVEDVEADDPQYGYKSDIERKFGKYTAKVPQLIKNATSQVFMAHDTSTYKFLSQTTQLSDLVARYALYQHSMTRKNNPLTKAEALQVAEDSFVNYDLPSHKSIQYMNDMGLLMFTKYYMRIQKTIMRLVREKPANLMAGIAAQHMINGLDVITDSSWIHSLGNNPLHDSALGLVGAIGELPAFKLL